MARSGGTTLASGTMLAGQYEQTVTYSTTVGTVLNLGRFILCFIVIF